MTSDPLTASFVPSDEGLPPIEAGKVYSVRKFGQRSSIVIKVRKVGRDGSGSGVAIVFASRIKVQARKYRASNAVTDFDFFQAREKVYSFQLSDAIPTDNVQGHAIPDCYLEADEAEKTKELDLTEAIRTGIAKTITDDVERGRRAVSISHRRSHNAPLIIATREYDTGFLDHEGDEPTGNYGDVDRREFHFLVGATRIHVREVDEDGKEHAACDVTGRVAKELGVEVEWNAMEIPLAGTAR